VASVTVTLGDRGTVVKTIPDAFYGTQVQLTGSYDVDSPNWYALVRNLRAGFIRANLNNNTTVAPPASGGDLPALSGTTQTMNEVMTLLDRLYQEPESVRTKMMLTGVATGVTGMPRTSCTGAVSAAELTTGPYGTGSDGGLRRWMQWVEDRYGLEAIPFVEPANEPALMWGVTSQKWYQSNACSAEAANWWINHQKPYFDAAKVVDASDVVKVGGPAYATGLSYHMNRWMRDHIQGYSGWGRHGGAFGPGTVGNVDAMDMVTIHGYGEETLVGSGLLDQPIVSGSSIPMFQKLANSFFYPTWDAVGPQAGDPKPQENRLSGFVGMYKRLRSLLDEMTGGSSIPIMCSEWIGTGGNTLWPCRAEQWKGGFQDACYAMAAIRCAGAFHATDNPHGCQVIGYVHQGPNRTWRISPTAIQGDRLIYTEGATDGGSAQARAGLWSFWGNARYWVQRRVTSRYVRDFQRQIPVSVAGNVPTPTWNDAGSAVNNNAVDAIQVVAGRLNASLVASDPHPSNPSANATDKTALLLVNADCVNSHTVTIRGFVANGPVAHVYLPTDAPDVTAVRTNVDLTVETLQPTQGGTELTVTIGPHEAHLFEIPVGAGGGGPPPTYPKTHTKVETFGGDLSGWTIPDPVARVEIASGKLELENNPGGGANYAEIQSDQRDLTGSYFFVEWPDGFSADGETFIEFGTDGNNRVTMYTSGGFLRATKRVGGVQTNATPVAVNATEMRWWRISDDAGTIRLEYADSSDDLKNDTDVSELWSFPIGEAPTLPGAIMKIGTGGTVASGVVTVDNVNNFPVAAAQARAQIVAASSFSARARASGATPDQSRVAWIPIPPPVVYPPGEYREIASDGSLGAAVVWDAAQGRFEYP
jgi:hypothetical protein